MLNASFTELHVPVAGLQTGADAGQSFEDAQPAHCFVSGLHTGVLPEQSAFVEHVGPATQTPIVPSQRGVVALHCELSTHCTHFFVCGLQIGAVPGHSEFFVQSVPHLPVVVLQMGVGSAHCELSVHSTHFFVC